MMVYSWEKDGYPAVIGILMGYEWDMTTNQLQYWTSSYYRSIIIGRVLNFIGLLQGYNWGYIR